MKFLYDLEKFEIKIKFPILLNKQILKNKQIIKIFYKNEKEILLVI